MNSSPAQVNSGLLEHVQPQIARAVRRKLLSWYDVNRRDLPWRRRSNDPYAQWVAEVMLQQTQVETVRDFYERFIKRFPDVRALAAADHDEVLRYWQGLGYYRRILNLHQATQALRENDYEIPRETAALRRLPGVGDYTASAIASIAFNQREAVVDGNVARVLARLFTIKEDMTSSTGRTLTKTIAQRLISPSRPGDFNQAWMDLGSLICKPRSPQCGHCPLKQECRACAIDRAESFPVRDKSRLKYIPILEYDVGVFADNGSLLLRKRPIGGLWSGLWEFPNVERSTTRFSSRKLRSLASSEGAVICNKLRRIGVVEHRLTHRLVKLHVYHGHAKRGEPSDDTPRRWVTRRGIRKISISTAHRRIMELITQIVV